MVMGTSPESSEIQRCIRETISTCKNAISIKDDILIFGQGQDHDQHLKEILTILQDKGLTLCCEKCFLGQPEVRWFGNIYSKDEMSPNPEKCKVIREWPRTQSQADIKVFYKLFNLMPNFYVVNQVKHPIQK